MDFEIEKLPQEVRKLLRIFGCDARLVGGCVRDLLFKKEVKDFDFATRFLPQETIKILQKNKVQALETGIKYGTITAVVNKKNFEITTLRQDENQQGRHTDVKFVDDYKIDASRRDFTINALYLDADGKIYDYFDGISDLKKGKVRFIGDAKKRIEEDFLRILRFFRFSIEYSKSIDEEGLQACIFYKKNLKKLSRERIRSELIKIFHSKNHKKLLEILRLMEKQKILAEIFSPKFDIKALERLLEIDKNADFELKIASAFLNKKTDLDCFISGICATNKEKKFFHNLFEVESAVDRKSLNRLLAFYDKDFVIKFYLFFVSKNSDFVAKELKYLREFILPKFPVSAQDLISLGLEGKQISEALFKIRTFWSDGGFFMDKKYLINSFQKNSVKFLDKK